MDMDNAAVDDDGIIIDPAALRGALTSRGLLGRAAREFGLEFLEGEAPGSSVTPRAMRELDGRVSAMGLTPRGAFEAGVNSHAYAGGPLGAPFDFGAGYFAGDGEGLVSIDAPRLGDYLEEALNGGDDDGFIKWLSDEGRVSARWAARMSNGGRHDADRKQQ